MDLFSMKSSVTLLIFTMGALLKEGLAITCFMCNSAPTLHGPLCSELDNKTSSVFKQDCDELTHPSNRSYTLCRKMHQTIIDNKGNEETRIIRQCGTDSPIGCQWKTRPNTLKVWYCHCTTDLCNAAPRPAGNIHTALVCTAAVWIGASLLLRRFLGGGDIL